MKYHLVIEGEDFLIEIENIHARPIIALVNGEAVEVWPPLASSTPQPESTSPRQTAPQPSEFEAATGPSQVRAPIPGTIISVSVKIGDPIKHSQELCVLEAMKMKSAIRASHAGIVKSISVTPGQIVRHQDLLMEIAPLDETGG
jgi:biotin carboxyl carrier protein